MAEERRSTPEKQLLKLIEGETAKEPRGSISRAKQHRAGILSIGAWTGRFLFLKDNLEKRFRGRSFIGLDIKAANNVLALSVVLIVLYMVLSVYSSVKEMQSMPNLAIEAKEAMKAGMFPDSSPLKAMSYYVDSILQRNIFKMGSTSSEEAVEEVVVEPAGERLSEMAQNLRLVGISWSNNPDAMVEDSQSARTFFVKRGQMVGKLKVQAILKDKIILSYEGAEIELK